MGAQGNFVHSLIVLALILMSRDNVECFVNGQLNNGASHEHKRLDDKDGIHTGVESRWPKNNNKDARVNVVNNRFTEREIHQFVNIKHKRNVREGTGIAPTTKPPKTTVSVSGKESVASMKENAMAFERLMGINSAQQPNNGKSPSQTNSSFESKQQNIESQSDSENNDPLVRAFTALGVEVSKAFRALQQGRKNPPDTKEVPPSILPPTNTKTVSKMLLTVNETVTVSTIPSKANANVYTQKQHVNNTNKVHSSASGPANIVSNSPSSANENRTVSNIPSRANQNVTTQKQHFNKSPSSALGPVNTKAASNISSSANDDEPVPNTSTPTESVNTRRPPVNKVPANHVIYPPIHGKTKNKKTSKGKTGNSTHKFI